MVIVDVLEQTLEAPEVLIQRIFSHREKQRIKVEDKCKSLFFLSDEYLAINKGGGRVRDARNNKNGEGN